MKMIIVLAALVAVALAAPAPQHQDQVVLVKETQHNSIGLPETYSYEYELSDGQSRQEQAQFKDGVNEEGKPTQLLVIRGSYRFVGPDGQEYVIQYVADENGFQPSGAHIPV